MSVPHSDDLTEVLSVFEMRQTASTERLGAFAAALDAVDLPGFVCVYATGSMARKEGDAHSDLDLFVIDTSDESQGEISTNNIEHALLKADLIRAARKSGFPEFSRDGAFLQLHSLQDLIGKTGAADDDFTNAFTARLLLLLESAPVLNGSGHDEAKRRVIASYWRDFEGNEHRFLPVFLVNDIVRYWKTLCLNYEAGRVGSIPTGHTVATWQARNRLRNIKLKFSRLWTCHVTLLYLLQLTREKSSVTPADMATMMNLTSFERFMRVREAHADKDPFDHALEAYAWFLSTVTGSKYESQQWLNESGHWSFAKSQGQEFQETMSGLITTVGGNSPLLPYLLV